MFSHWISWTLDFLDSLQTRPDPTADPTSTCGAQFSYPIPRQTRDPPSADLTLESAVAPCWVLSYLKDLRGNK